MKFDLINIKSVGLIAVNYSFFKLMLYAVWYGVMLICGATPFDGLSHHLFAVISTAL